MGSDPASDRAAGASRFALFAYGFRPFFLLAGWYALLVVPAWVLVHTHGLVPLGAMPPQLWHAHEMLYGFVGAAVAGFLLTAVPSWTGASGFAGPPLVILSALWIIGRAAFAAAAVLPAWFIAALELAFLPALAFVLAPPLVRSGNRNTILLVVIGALWLSDAAFMFGVASDDALTAQRALRFAINLLLVLVTVIGGRIVPSFTANAARQRGDAATVRSWPAVEWGVLTTMIAVAIVDLWLPDTVLSGWIAAVAAVAQAARMTGWRTLSTRRQPILWVLHLGYGWLPVGLALKALWLVANAPWAAYWLHALTMGVFGTMIPAVMTRVALGHTGRPLIVRGSIAVSYGLLALGTLVRIAAPVLWPTAYVPALAVSSALWSGAFVLFVWVYTPILITARADGKPG